MPHSPPRPLRPRALDAAVLAWCVAWVVLGIVAGSRIADIGDGGRAVVAAGNGVREAGVGLAALGDVPFAGDALGDVSERLDTAGREAEIEGAQAAAAADDLAWIIGLAVALGPSMALVAGYLPWRLSAGRPSQPPV